ncbi:MAG: hypothetical protein GIS02_05230 [Methanosarcinales archaeon]|uniref:Uncharacterized protein n=1 Tax=Candidatus Ethanoperedens thermophilum TaxID=2766897 RepID=A0A848DBI9_9EURY|nr:hypothetical protein [Candidatus Ethanoperedens thermophilum]
MFDVSITFLASTVALSLCFIVTILRGWYPDAGDSAIMPDDIRALWDRNWYFSSDDQVG